MCMKKYLFILFLIYIGIVPICAQEEQTEICIDFRVGSSHIDPTYMDNEHRLSEILAYIDRLHNDASLSVTKLVFSGVASPEGSIQLNKQLASKRLLALENYIRSRITLPDSLVVARNDMYIPWNFLIAQVEDSDITYKDKVLSILKGESRSIPYTSGSTIDSRIPALKSLDNGKVWNTLNQQYFARMRNACAVFLAEKSQPIPEPEPTSIPPIEPDTVVVDTIPSVPEATPDTVVTSLLLESEEWVRKLHLKTNALGLGMAIANVAAEVDLAKHWSFTLPIYYSAWDYFKSTIKFRTFAVQPELRYWLAEDNDGFFAGAHIGLAYYNFALDGDYRYQDHNRKTPSMGGGISAGYRLPISKNNCWRVEFTIGGGVYSRHYDKFHNTPRTKDGLLIESVKKSYWGIDQAAVTFSYSFNLKKKGGKQ